MSLMLVKVQRSAYASLHLALEEPLLLRCICCTRTSYELTLGLMVTSLWDQI